VTCLSPAGYSTVPNDTGPEPNPIRHCTTPLVCETRSMILPFPLQVGCLVSLEVGTTRYSPYAHVPVGTACKHRFFPRNSFTLTTTAFVSDRPVTREGRLA